MSEIMDPFAYELLSRPLPHGFDQPPCGGAMNSEITTEQMDYLRAVGVLPPRPSAAVPHSPAATFRLRFAVDYASDLPTTCELPAAAPHLAPLAPASNNIAAAAGIKNSTTDYDADIDASLRATEKDAMERPSPDYLDTTQGGRIDPVARASLVQWMCEFSRRYYLDEASTLHRAVSYVDRYLSARALPEDGGGGGGGHKYRLRVLGAVALYAAAKLENPGAARDLNAVDIACWCGYDTSYREVLDTERAMVAALGYRLGGPTANTFVDHFTRHIPGREEGEEDLVELQRVAHQIADMSLFEYRCLKLLPSAVAAAAIFLAGLALKPSHDSEQVRRWGRELERLTGYKAADVRDGVECMYRLMHAPGFVVGPVFFADPS